MLLKPRLRSASAHAELRAHDGAVDPLAVIEALVAAARQRGGLLHRRATRTHPDPMAQ